MAFEIEANIPEVVFGLEKLKTDQIPFATSLALNLTLKDSQTEVRNQLPRRFSIRRPWVPRGVVVKPSSKRQLWGTISQRDPFMALHEPGGTKQPKGRAIAVPAGKLRTEAKTRVLTKSKRPRAQLRKKSVFRGETKKGTPAIIKRGNARSAPEVLFLLIGSAKVKPRFQFASTIERTVRKTWPRNFGKALARAIKTAR